MALPELVANSPVPGTPAALGTITADITTTGGTTISTSAIAPAPLQAAGQFRICVDNEIMIVTAGATTTTWTVTRQAENSSPATHTSGASIYHFLTADALKNMATQFGFPTATVTVAASNSPSLVQTAAQYVCDGTADQVEINNAILSLPSGGGLVVLAEGTYTINAPIVFQEDYSGLAGMTRGTVIISMAAGFSGSAMLTCNRQDLGVGTSANRPCSNITLRDFTIVGNYIGTQSTTDGIYFCAFRSLISNVDVYQMNGSGIQVQGVATASRGGAGDWSCYGTLIQTCKIHANGNAGVRYNGLAGDSGITQCEVFENAGGGIIVPDTINQVSGCYVWGNFDQSVAGGSRQGAGIYLQAGSGRIPITGCKIEQNRGGVVCGPTSAASGSEYTITGNTFASNSSHITAANVSSGAMPGGYIVAGSANVRSDIEIGTNSGGSPTAVLIIGNDINPLVYSGDESAYALQISTGSGVLVRFNNLLAGQSGTVNNTLGGGNIFSIGQNLAYITEASGQATITSALTSVAVTHGLAYAPVAQDISLTLTNLPTNAIGELYVDTIGSTTFTVHCRNAPGAATAIIGWAVQTHRFS